MYYKKIKRSVSSQIKTSQSINQSIKVFQGKTQMVQFTNIYKKILFFTYNKCNNEGIKIG